MNDIKLIKLLKTLSAAEFSEFERFVNSPFFSTGRNLSAFFNCLKSFYPEFDHKNFTEEKIYKKLFPQKKFEAKTSVNLIHKFSSELHKLGKEYLVQTELRNDEGRKYFYLLNKLREKKLFSEFDREYKNSSTSFENIYKGGANDFINRYFLMQSFIEYSIDKGDIENVFRSIQSLSDLSAVSFLIKGYRNIDTNNAALGFNIHTGYSLADNLISHLNSKGMIRDMKQNNDKYYPYIAVSHSIHKMVSDPDDIVHFFNLKELVSKYIDLFGHTEQYILFNTMINYCILNLDGKFHDLLIKEEFEIYKKVFELGVYKYKETDMIHINNFRSILLSAIDNGELDWAEDFVNNYIKEMHSEYQENMKFYSMAIIHFEKGEFEKSLENIIKVKYDFFLFKMDVKITMFKIYFELELYDQAYSIIDTLKHYIVNSKDLSDKMRLRGSNFAKYAAKLLNAKSPDHDTDPGLLTEMISAEKHLGSKNWFLKKLSQS